MKNRRDSFRGILVISNYPFGQALVLRADEKTAWSRHSARERFHRKQHDLSLYSMW
jgi:hypothetical protein